MDFPRHLAGLRFDYSFIAQRLTMPRHSFVVMQMELSYVSCLLGAPILFAVVEGGFEFELSLDSSE